MQALDAYKRSSGRMFPTCSEILEVIRSLGYIKLNEEEKQLLTSIQAVEAELATLQRSTAYSTFSLATTRQSCSYSNGDYRVRVAHNILCPRISVTEVAKNFGCAKFLS